MALEGTAAKKVVMIVALVGLFLASFVFFLFLTFPYEVLKESIAAEVSQSTGYIVRIGDMSAGFPLGLKAQDIKIEAPSGNSLSLKLLRADVHPLWLITGKLSVSSEIGAGNGNIELALDFGIFDLIGGNALPKHFSFEAKNFPLDEAVAFGLSAAATSPTANPMVAPLLSAIGVTALLNGSMDFNLDNKNPTQSTGRAEISLTKAVLKLSHPSLGLPDQAFKKAVFKAKVENGSVVLDQNSGFASDELELTPQGKITLKPQATASLLDLKVVLKLDKTLKDKFGFVIDAVRGTATGDGLLTLQVRGSMDQPVTTTL